MGAGALVQRFTVETALGYGFTNDRTYEVLPIRPDSLGSEKRVFAWVLVRGKAELFEVNRQFYARKAGEVFTLRTRLKDVYMGNRWYRAEDREYERLLGAYLFADCPSIRLNNSGGLSYSNFALTQLFEVYNRCVYFNGSSSVALAPLTKPWIKWEWTAYAGVGTHSLQVFTYKNGPEGTLSSGLGPLFGLQGGFSSPRLNERLSVHLGFVYGNLLLTGTYETAFGTVTERSDFFLRVRSIQVPLLLRYRVPLGRLNPYVQGGISTRFNNTSSAWYQTETEDRGVVLINRADLPRLDSGDLGWVLGVGLHANLKRHLRLNAEVRYERTTGDALYSGGLYSRSTSFSSLSVLVGVGFW